AILNVTSIVLSLFTAFTVAGVFILRSKKEQYRSKFKAVGYPLTGIFFLLVEVWMIYYTMKVKTTESLIGISLLSIGVILYFLLANKRTQKASTINQEITINSGA
ncbi:MAG TPA: hypothetical protein VNS32_05880, partial [Flavisolibacter sp.]|nr:hypothetical protein [Flavisolibacter sp.]